MNVNLSFLSSRSKVVECTPPIGKNFNFISEFRVKSCGMYPPQFTSGRNFGKSTFPCFNDWKYNAFAIFNGGQKKFGDERPFTREGNYLVYIHCPVTYRWKYQIINNHFRTILQLLVQQQPPPPILCVWAHFQCGILRNYSIDMSTDRPYHTRRNFINKYFYNCHCIGTR